MTDLKSTLGPTLRHVARYLLVTVVLCLLAACSSGSDGGTAENTDDPTDGATDGNPDVGVGGELDGAADDDPDTDTAAIPIDTGSEITVLTPLPGSPLTAAPTVGDEPVADDAAFHVAVNFPVVREATERLPDTQQTELTEADFALGLPESVVTVPEGLDTTTNGAPFFENLSNQRVIAGETIEIRFAPQDPEGGQPRMFRHGLPDRAEFVSNADGSRSLIWQPLQTDLGVTSFTVVAMDPADEAYRTLQTVLIAVDAPADLGTLPNEKPRIAGVGFYMVRAGDPAVVEIEVTDRNGTLPTIELLDAPEGATLTQHPRFEEIHVLRFVPVSAGELEIVVMVRDEIDTTLTSTERFTLSVEEPAHFVRGGARLKTLAASQNLAIGFAAAPDFYRRADGAIYGSIAAEEFNIMTPESSLKMGDINPLPGRYEFAAADNLMAFARANDMQVRGHTLVWYAALPDWIQQKPADELEVHMREFMTRVMSRYNDDIDIWDVVNEPMAAEGGGLRSSIWSESMGERYIDIAFAQARALDPNATLVLNEYDIGFDGPKWQGLLALLDRLLHREVSVDAVGFQMHVFATFDQFDELAANFAAVAALGLDIHITELDVSLTDTTDEQQQAEVYRRVVQVCLAEPRCRIIQSWGFTDRYSFRSFWDPLPFDEGYTAKPAYSALQEALGG